jgi:hypothetical protein
MRSGCTSQDDRRSGGGSLLTAALMARARRDQTRPQMRRAPMNPLQRCTLIPVLDVYVVALGLQVCQYFTSATEPALPKRRLAPV